MLVLFPSIYQFGFGENRLFFFHQSTNMALTPYQPSFIFSNSGCFGFPSFTLTFPQRWMWKTMWKTCGKVCGKPSRSRAYRKKNDLFLGCYGAAQPPSSTFYSYSLLLRFSSIMTKSKRPEARPALALPAHHGRCVGTSGAPCERVMKN